MKINYGEILFIGKCNCKCYYCLANEMPTLLSKCESQLSIHFSNWKNFDNFINILKKYNVKVIYLSSTITEPLLYKYIYELILYLKNEGFRVGIRSNAYLFFKNKKAISELDEEISFSLNSLNPVTNELICKNKNVIDWKKLLKSVEKMNKKVRITIVINRYNENEIKDMLDFFSKYECITYIQLRKLYKYKEENSEDSISFYNILNWLKESGNYISNFHESSIYNYRGKNISVWETVFKKESLTSINYFTDGLITNNNLLIPGYEESDKNEQ